MTFKTLILDENEISRALKRISHEIIERNDGIENVVLIGIRTRGVPLAERIRAHLAEYKGKTVDCGSLDITFYRDDMALKTSQPKYSGTDVTFSVENKDVVLIDDVLYTGRTARAALDALIEMGRPKSVQLAVLIDRGHRELPIRADYVGKNLPTADCEIVNVELRETDGADKVVLLENTTKKEINL